MYISSLLWYTIKLFQNLDQLSVHLWYVKYLIKFLKNFFIVILAECADMWYELSSKEKEENIHVMKIYLLSPFLFGQVKSNQDDKVNCGIRNTIASQNTT